MRNMANELSFIGVVAASLCALTNLSWKAAALILLITLLIRFFGGD